MRSRRRPGVDPAVSALASRLGRMGALAKVAKYSREQLSEMARRGGEATRRKWERERARRAAEKMESAE